MTAILACAGCAAETNDAAGDDVALTVQTGESHTDIFGGNKDDDFQSIPGVVALRVGTGATFELCSGALVAPNLVLTARHCLTKTVGTSVSCDENGKSANGEHVAGDLEPSSIGVYVGPKPSLGGRAVAVGKAIVAPTGAYLCDSDIGLLVLDRDITDVAPLTVRTSGGYAKGESIRSVGYGQNDDSTPIGTRFRKDGVKVLAQGKAISASNTPLGPHEFEVGESICQGDSGGPAISEETGAVIGVVSRGGDCDEDFGHIYTTTVGFESLFAHAIEIAGGTMKTESGAAPASADVTGGAGTSAEPTVPTQSGGCSTSRAPVSGGASLGLVALAMVGGLVARRRRAA